jgi:hypothetical protein
LECVGEFWVFRWSLRAHNLLSIHFR